MTYAVPCRLSTTGRIPSLRNPTSGPTSLENQPPSSLTVRSRRCEARTTADTGSVRRAMSAARAWTAVNPSRPPTNDTAANAGSSSRSRSRNSSEPPRTLASSNSARCSNATSSAARRCVRSTSSASRRPRRSTAALSHRAMSDLTADNRSLPSSAEERLAHTEPGCAATQSLGVSHMSPTIGVLAPQRFTEMSEPLDAIQRTEPATAAVPACPTVTSGASSNVASRGRRPIDRDAPIVTSIGSRVAARSSPSRCARRSIDSWRTSAPGVGRAMSIESALGAT